MRYINLRLLTYLLMKQNIVKCSLPQYNAKYNLIKITPRMCVPQNIVH